MFASWGQALRGEEAMFLFLDYVFHYKKGVCTQHRFHSIHVVSLLNLKRIQSSLETMDTPWCDGGGVGTAFYWLRIWFSVRSAPPGSINVGNF
jgi:hypothetical protein